VQELSAHRCIRLSTHRDHLVRLGHQADLAQQTEVWRADAMELKFKPFNPPKRPAPVRVWSASHWYLYVLTLTLGATTTETWWSLPLVGFAFMALVWCAIREWRWNRYADRVEGTFVEIGQAANALSKHLQALAKQVEERAAAAARESGTVALSVEASTTHDVRYWAAMSKGQN
jgi:hypothetical protein